MKVIKMIQDNIKKIVNEIKPYDTKLICVSKTRRCEEILEAYFNIIYTGPSIYGVKEAALYYFDKNISDLNLEECAFLAGLNNSPNS